MVPNVIKKYKAAAVNAEPGWLDLDLSVEKTIHWINEAGKNGCKLVAFPELCKSKRTISFSPVPSLHSSPIMLAHLFRLLDTHLTIY